MERMRHRIKRPRFKKSAHTVHTVYVIEKARQTQQAPVIEPAINSIHNAPFFLSISYSSVTKGRAREKKRESERETVCMPKLYGKL